MSPISSAAHLSSTSNSSSKQTSQKRTRCRQQSAAETHSKPNLLSPPRSTPPGERPTKRRKTQGGQLIYERGGDEHLYGPRFWGNLSRLPLAKSALKEFDRRNNQDNVTCPARPARPDLDIASAFDIASEADLPRFARHGGPDLSDLRGFPEMPPSSGRQKRGRGGIRKTSAAGKQSRGSRRGDQSESSAVSKKTKSTGPYDAAFKQHLIDCKVWPIDHYFGTGEQPPAPDNLQEIIQEIHGHDGGRASLEPTSFTDEDFQRVHKAYHIATAEEAQSRSLDAIEGALGVSSSHHKRGPVKLVGLAPLTPENMVPGNPDRVYGARAEELQPSIRRALSHLILPTAHKDIACPNFVVHVKGPDGTPGVAKLQSVYDGGLAARGMQALWAFGKKPDGEDSAEDAHANIARTITCTVYDGLLRMYAVHLYRPEGGSVQDLLPTDYGLMLSDAQYSTTKIGSWMLYEDVEQFRSGAAAFRNGIEWARRQRDYVIARANKKGNVDKINAGVADPN